MRVWIDLANSPHVPLFEPVIERLEADGATVLLTARNHAQTVALAQRAFGDIRVVGDESPAGRVRKGVTIATRARALTRLARKARPHVALSHGWYAQIVAARAARVPALTMMDYEFQPANHLSFRLGEPCSRPSVFPADALRRCGARAKKVIRYDGFKEELYLGSFEPDESVIAALGIDASHVIVVMRPPPEGALYHQGGNARFDEILERAAAREDARVVVLPRATAQAEAYRGRDDLIVLHAPIDGRSLLALADLMIGAGGTMNREAALLGTPTYTVFAERLAAVDRELIRLGLMHDLRDPAARPSVVKKGTRDSAALRERGDAALRAVVDGLHAIARSE